MVDGVRLYIVTDDREKAAWEMLWLRPFDVPSFIALVTDPVAIARIPSGACCRGQWYRGRSLAQIAWDERRFAFDLQAPGDAFWAQYNAWYDKRLAHYAQINADAIAAEKAAGTYDPFIPSQSAA